MKEELQKVKRRCAIDEALGRVRVGLHLSGNERNHYRKIVNSGGCS